MNVYITKLNGMGHMMQSVQHMTAEIAHQLGFREMGVYYYNVRTERPDQRSVRFDGIIAGMQPGDIVICQFHTWNGLGFERGLVEHIKAYHGRIVIFIQSLEALMIRGSRFMLGETVELYNRAEALIVPSLAMKKFLLDSGIRSGMKFIVQEMWDWTIGMQFQGMPKFRREILYTGGADAPLAKDWNYDIPLKSCAMSKPGELMLELSEGGFGLEWPGDDQEFEYMRYGNSYSLSRYLATGLPVIVPAGISCQKLIEENHLGLVADSLDEAVATVRAMGEAEYQEYVRHVGQFAPALRNGYYTKKCLIESVQALFREDIGKAFVQETGIYDLGDMEFIATSLKKSYGGNLALSWEMKARPDGFLIYDSAGRLIEETENGYQHYFLIKDGSDSDGFTVKAYMNVQKGKLIVAESAQTGLTAETYTKPLVSLIMPIYNAEDYLAKSIDTVLAQTLSDTEIILVDDGSTDRSAEIVDWYAANYPNVLVTHQENGGLPAARNTGIKRVNGAYIAFMDSDDMIRPSMLEKLYTSVKKNDCDIAVTSIYQIVQGKYEKSIGYPLQEDVEVAMDDFLRMYAANGYALVSVWNKIYRASLVKEHMFPRFLFEDEAWTPYILSYGDKICYLDGALYEYVRSIRSETLIEKAHRRTEDEIFREHKRSILFYLEHGNPARKALLKEFAKSELGLFSRTTGYEEYKKLRERIAGE